MAETDPQAGTDGLQFERVDLDAGAERSPQVAVICAACHAPVGGEYYSINGNQFCADCRRNIEAAADIPEGLGPLIQSGLLGVGAGIAGAVIYYAVLVITNLEIGLVAILIGYMVGYAVRKGARGRGGLRFQLVAVTLTYLSVAFAYTPIVIGEASRAQQPAARSTPADSARPGPEAPQLATTAAGAVAGLALMLAFIASLPVLFVVETLPSGLISALIIGIGMRQAWRMTAAPHFEISGPYRVGPEPASAPA